MYRTNRIHKSEMQWLSKITFNGGSGAKIVIFRLGFAEMVIQIVLAWWPCLLFSWMSNRDYTSLVRRDFFSSYFMHIHIYVFVCILCNNTLDMIYIYCAKYITKVDILNCEIPCIRGITYSAVRLP